jgi:hypothetical protein
MIPTATHVSTIASNTRAHRGHAIDLKVDRPPCEAFLQRLRCDTGFIWYAFDPVSSQDPKLVPARPSIDEPTVVIR